MKLQLYYPIKPFIKYQNFGDNDACSQISTLPLAKRKIVAKKDGICPVGYEELYPLLGMKGHTGIDMFGGRGYPVYYCGPTGFVEEVQTEVERGLGVGIITNDKFEMEGGEYHAKTRYWHLMSYNVVKGQTVQTGDFIGLANSTGLSSGDHLHFELKPNIKNSMGVWYNVFQDNGYYGSVNPEPYFNKLYAQQAKRFDKNLEYGQSGSEVLRLQSILKEMGFFTYPLCTGFYGSETAKAVLAFQWKYKIINSWQYIFYGGRYFHEKTRNKLNNLL